MPGSSHIYDIGPDDFSTMVLENSSRGLVLVYFWSPDVGPCMKLLPDLVALADEFSGRFLLGLLDTGQHRQYARDIGVISIPTVRLYLHGEVVETIHGAFSRGYIRGIIKKNLAEGVATSIRSGEAVADGQFANVLERARKMLAAGDAVNAAVWLDSLPREALEIAEISLVKTHADLIRAAQLSPGREAVARRIDHDAEDFPAIYQLAALHLVGDDYESALDLLVTIRQRSSDAAMAEKATRSIFAVFALLGESHPLVARFSAMLDQADSTDRPGPC